MRIILLFILLACPMAVISQNLYSAHIGLIKDPDGFTFIRSGPSKDSSVLDSLHSGEFFSYESNDTSQWYQVYKFWNTIGFVHKNRIQDYPDFSRKELRLLFDSLFSIELELHKRLTPPDHEGMDEWEPFHEEKFDPALEWFISFIEFEYEELLLKKFIDILILESGSADEIPPTALGYLYLAHPEKVLSLVRDANNGDLVDLLEFGFYNVAYEDEFENFEELDAAIKNLIADFEKK